MDKNRRKFIKILLIGGASFMVGKILGPVFSKFFDNTSSSTKNDKLANKNPVTFKVIQDKQTFSIYDNNGEEIFQIDNEA